MFRQTLFNRYPRSILALTLVIFAISIFSLVSFSSTYFA
jgi:hypothetical protein